MDISFLSKTRVILTPEPEFSPLTLTHTHTHTPRHILVALHSGSPQPSLWQQPLSCWRTLLSFQKSTVAFCRSVRNISAECACSVPEGECHLSLPHASACACGPRTSCSPSPGGGSPGHSAQGPSPLKRWQSAPAALLPVLRAAALQAPAGSASCAPTALRLCGRPDPGTP